MRGTFADESSADAPSRPVSRQTQWLPISPAPPPPLPLLLAETPTQKRVFPLVISSGTERDVVPGAVPFPNSHPLRRGLYGAVPTPAPASSEVDLRKQTPTSKGVLSAIWDQGQTSACTAYALLGAVEYVTAAVSGTRPWNPIAPSQTFSKRFVYYNTRAIENTTGQDCGAVLADGIKALQKYGACRATKCADAASLILKAPTQEAFTQALSACALSVRSIPNSREKMMECLDHFGLPFVIGIAVFPQFMKVVSLRSSPRRGIVDMPPLPIDWNSCLGGHAILCVGYKFIDNQLYWIVRNSWGTSWGDGGYCYIHGDYFTNSAISTDQWAIEKVGPSQSTRPASGARR